MLEELTNDYEKAEFLQNILISHATGGSSVDAEYRWLRKHLVSNEEYRDIIPPFVRTCRDLSAFWQFIKNEFSTYAERREFLYEKFIPLLDFTEQINIPNNDYISRSLTQIDEASLHKEWKKSLKRIENDPDGAITSARTLLESVCKQILDSENIDYSSNVDINNLYKQVAVFLKLSPDQHSENIFKQILSGCNSVVTGLGTLRNKLGDAHGASKNKVKPKKRHAELAVNLAGTMCLFLISTYKENIDSKS